MKTSLIIPTYNRPVDLQRCLTSVSKNSMLPDEVIIVEQGEISQTRKIANPFKKYFKVDVLFLEVKSSSQARNLGISRAKREILFFIDDDITISQNYLQEATSYLDQNKEVMGIQGKLKGNFYRPRFIDKLRSTIGLLFNCCHFDKRRKVLRSSEVTKTENTTIGNQQFLNGGQMTVRKKVFNEGLSFNARLMRWCMYEDHWLTYQIYKKYGEGTLKTITQIEWTHHDGLENKISNFEEMRMMAIYRYLFWVNERYSNNFFNLLCFLWSRVGYVCLILVRRNFREIARNEIDYNRFIFKD